MELIITASVGPVWSGQHLEHNAQRQKAPAHSTRYSAITIEEFFPSVGGVRFPKWERQPKSPAKLRLKQSSAAPLVSQFVPCC